MVGGPPPAGRAERGAPLPARRLPIRLHAPEARVLEVAGRPAAGDGRIARPVPGTACRLFDRVARAGDSAVARGRAPGTRYLPLDCEQGGAGRGALRPRELRALLHVPTAVADAHGPTVGRYRAQADLHRRAER